MDLSSLGLRPWDDLDPLHIHPWDAISLHPSGSCSKNILQMSHSPPFFVSFLEVLFVRFSIVIHQPCLRKQNGLQITMLFTYKTELNTVSCKLFFVWAIS